MRMMVMFTKPYPLRHIGHLDLMRTMQRALRRSGLPVRYSQGFNPHIKLSFASPLSVGIAGDREIMDVPLDHEVEEEEFVRKLNGAMPGGMQVAGVRRIDDKFPTLMGLAAGSRYRIEPDTGAPQFQGAVAQLLSCKEYVALRKTKSGEKMCDILPYIDTLVVSDSALLFTAKNLQSGSLKPSVVMNALFALGKITPCFYAVTRETILATDTHNNLVPLEGIAYE